MYIKDIFHSNTGVSQYRLEESTSKDAVLYTLYGQNELYEDLAIENKFVQNIKALLLNQAI